MQRITQDNPRKYRFPDLDVRRRAQNYCLDPGEEEEMGGELVVDGLVELGVG